MKVLLIAPQPFYQDRGTPIVVFEEISLLTEIGFHVDVATYPIGTEIEMPKVRVFRTANPLIFRSVAVGFSFRKVLLDLLLLSSSIRLLRRTSYDCIHGVEEGAAIALICRLIFGTPVVYDMHSSLPDQLHRLSFFATKAGRKAALGFEGFLLKKADAVIASTGLGCHVKTRAPGRSVWECNFFCDGSVSPGAPDLVPRRYGRPTIVYSGNFSSYQGLDLLMEAAIVLRGQVPDILFILVGGTESDIPPIARLVEKHGLCGTVELHNRVPRLEVPAFLASADVLVLPRRHGMNAPLKLFEYMRSLRPIVATDIPAHRSLLNDESSLLVNPDPESLAGGLLKALQDRELAFKLASGADRTARSFQKESLRKTLIEAYRHAVARGPCKGPETGAGRTR
jgi:glycosyltransferase involved in cell wall biosynthesis